MKKNRIANSVGNRILLRLQPLETEGGIILLEQEHQASNEAYVINMGNEVFVDFDSPWCKVGDRVLISRYAGRQINLGDNHKYSIVNDTDILAVFPEEALNNE